MCKDWNRFCGPEQPDLTGEILQFVPSWFDFSLELFLTFQNGAKTVNFQRECPDVCFVLKYGQTHIFKHWSNAEQQLWGCYHRSFLNSGVVRRIFWSSLSAWWQQIYQRGRVTDFVCTCIYEAEWFLGTHYIAVMFWSCFRSNGFAAECLTNLLGWLIVSWLKKLICSNWQISQSSESRCVSDSYRC